MSETPAGTGTDELVRQISSDSGRRWQRVTAALALAIVDASLSADTPTLERLQRQLRTARGQLTGADLPDAAERRGALLALGHAARLGATRAAATEAVEAVEPDSLAHSMLWEIVERAPITSGELGGILLKDKYTVSRTGRKLIEHGLARKHAVGRQRAWEATRRGTAAIEQLGPPKAEPAPVASTLPAQDRDEVRTYLKAIGNVRRLTDEDERALAKRVERGDAEAKERLVDANRRLVASVARRHLGEGLSFMELVQAGELGLTRAVDKFDWRRGYRLSRYATFWIRHAIQRALYAQDAVEAGSLAEARAGEREDSVDETAERFAAARERIRRKQAERSPESRASPTRSFVLGITTGGEIWEGDLLDVLDLDEP